MTSIHKTSLKILCGILILISLTGCNSTSVIRAAESITPPSGAASSADSLQSMLWVGIHGSGFLLNGEPYRFIGANTTNVGFYEQYHLSIEDAIRQAKDIGISDVRIYLRLGTGPWSGRKMDEYDRVLESACKNQRYVIAVITDYCCAGTDWEPPLDQCLEAAPYCNFPEPSSLAAFKRYISVQQRLEGLTFRVEGFAAMGKPVVLEEFGLGSQRSLGVNPAASVLESWADSYRAQIDAAFTAGASGVMFWGWGVPKTKDVPLVERRGPRYHRGGVLPGDPRI